MSRTIMEGKQMKMHHSHSAFPKRSSRDSGTSSSTWKSNIDVCVADDLNDIVRLCLTDVDSDLGCGEYYKRYEYDEITVKENINDPDGDRALDALLTNSQIEKLEMNAFKDIPEGFRHYRLVKTSSLDSNVKGFKTRVEKLFDSFYENMQDIGQYQKRFNDIIARNKEDALKDMEDIIVSELSSKTNFSPRWGETSISSSISGAETRPLEREYSVVDTYKNENYFTDSSQNRNKATSSRTGLTSKSFLLTDRSIIITMNKLKNNSSEINIKHSMPDSVEIKEFAASADNLIKIAAKELYIQRRMAVIDNQENNFKFSKVKVIPIKESPGMGNIYLGEEHNGNDYKNNKSFVSKICSYICKKIRRC